ncbi:hypothetical protein GGQ85_001659 [Nitrobacter vulgaris]|uniref:hypothetical protein n=1 Tax=Nitrobacter vulgaris TaxID=29421 RepID=UPI0028576506|nr:hypothetical protein [Nitrobacter vulgaris]MDR6303960.1 hypothetical protein [Nitrobacter vulgaris]
MSRTPARFTQADVARAIRAAQQTGAGNVEIKPDGTICIRLSPESTEPAAADDEPLADEIKVRLW